MVAGLKIWIHARQYEDSSDYWDGNWLNVTASYASTGARVEAAGPILHLSEVNEFLEECRRLYDTLDGEATLGSIEPNLRVVLRADDALGGISACTSITPDHLAEEHSFTARIDQSHLPYIIRGLESVLRQFPVRGRQE